MDIFVLEKAFEVAKKTISKRINGKLYLVGWPRFDLNKPKNKIFYFNEIKSIKKNINILIYFVLTLFVQI